VTKYQGSTVPKHNSAAEQDHSLTLPAPPPNMAYQPVPTVRTPAPPVDPTESGLYRAVQDSSPEEAANFGFDASGRDTVPSPPPEVDEDDETSAKDEPVDER
jgi:hypothetical protein